MAAFGDVGAVCSLASCRRQVPVSDFELGFRIAVSGDVESGVIITAVLPHLHYSEHAGLS